MADISLTPQPTAISLRSQPTHTNDAHHRDAPNLNFLLAARRQLLLGVHRRCKPGGIAQHPELPQHHWHAIVCS